MNIKKVDTKTVDYVDLCVDFDGVIHSYVSPYVADHIIPDLPVQGSQLWLRNVLKRYSVAVFSVRNRTPVGIKAMRAWFTYHGMGDLLCRLSFPVLKPPAQMYIDDRAWLFTGVFPTFEQIEKFKSWID